ncbi:MAG: ribosome silencing factor [Candidatus Weimeria sp.]|nr:ribosome silencing factor [Candidatus Weimeria sp.]
MDAKEMVKVICKAIDDKKGEDIEILDIAGISVVSDYFVVASASNQNQLNAMKDAIEEEMYKAGKINARQVEGNRSSTWILMDYEDVIVHLFTQEDRLFYNLERIWKDGKQVALEEL